MLREIWSAAGTDPQRVVAALGVLSRVCFLRVGEAPSIRPCDVEVASLVFFRSKPKQQGWHRRPLARYPAAWAGWLRDYACEHGVAWDAPYVAGGAPTLERGLAELLAGPRWRGYAWHCFRRGGASASWGRKPNLLYFKWWGGWTDTPTAMRYAMAFTDPEVLGPLQLPSPSSESVGNGEEEITNCIAVWGGGMFGADSSRRVLAMSVLSTCFLLRVTAKLIRWTQLLRMAVLGVLYPAHPKTRIPAPWTAPTAAPRAAPAWRSSSRPREGLKEAHSRPSELGQGVGEGSDRGSAADPVHKVADASARPPAPPSKLCLWASPVLSKGRGRLARRWEWRISKRGNPPHPNAALCAPAPSKLRPGRDHRLNVGVSGRVQRRSMRPRRRRHGGASRAARGAATEPQLYVPFLLATPNSDLWRGAARIPGHARATTSSVRAAPSGGGGGGSTVYTVTAPRDNLPQG